MNNRLKKLRKVLNLTQKDFATKINVATSTLAMFETGQRVPKDIHINRICSEFNINENWLRTGFGDIFSNNDLSLLEILKNSQISDFEKKLLTGYLTLPPDIRQHLLNHFKTVFSDKSKQSPANKNVINIKEKEYVKVKVFEQSASAGFGNYLYEDQAYDELDFEKSTVPLKTDIGIRIKGDSMEPDINNGDIVFVNMTTNLENGDIGIFILNNEAYCKQLKIDYANKKVYLLSLNDKYKPIEITENDEIRTIGKVL